MSGSQCPTVRRLSAPSIAERGDSVEASDFIAENQIFPYSADLMNTILLVEDDPVLGRGLSLNLEIEGYQIQWVKDLASAATETSSRRFELILLDLGLPDGNGLSFLKQLRESGSATPVIILTAKTDEDSVVEGLQLGANDYMRKPFGDRELIARIKTALREPQPKDRQLKFADLVLHLDRRLLVVE